MLKFLCAAVISLASLASHAATYNYQGTPYTYAGNTDPTKSALGTSNAIQFTFTTADAIEQAGFASVLSWSFTDGTNTLTYNDPGAGFRIFLSASADSNKVFDFWEIEAWQQAQPYPSFFNTTFAEDGRTYDWSQNSHGNYGGNWASNGTWTTSAVSQVPEPSAAAMFAAALGVCAVATRRSRSARRSAEQ